MNDDEFPENGLKTALIMHLISSGHIMLNGGTVCNFLIHPSMKTSQHSCFANKIGNYLNEISHSHNEAETREAFERAYESLRETKTDILPFEQIYGFIAEQLQEDKIGILMLNSIVSYDENTQYEKGINVIVGGNSLGRGVTFPAAPNNLLLPCCKKVRKLILCGNMQECLAMTVIPACSVYSCHRNCSSCSLILTELTTVSSSRLKTPATDVTLRFSILLA